MRKLTLFFFLAAFVVSAFAQNSTNKLIINADQSKYTINKHIYGHFSEHLGRCIYGGIWVGEDSEIQNLDGYRQDVLEALKAINIPNLRWPGGCFADEYHWEDGIGPRNNRPTMINTNWGGVTEDNSFGTHEFLNYCELIGTEPYICGNVGSGTVKEMSSWVEYINFDGISPMSNLRKKNGREEPWGVKFWGVGNENSGCGGTMTAEYYADLYKRFGSFCKDYGDNKLFKIAGGAHTGDVHWTEVLIKNVPHNMLNGISLHYYTVTNTWQNKGSSTKFTEKEYITTLRKASEIDDFLNRHTVAMDKYDPEKEVGFVVDEWGTWYDVEPGTNPGFLYQQNTLRDAFVAGITLNVFNNHADRVYMANLAQTINVLQSLILTNEEKMLLTPTYHVFDLYQVHMDAKLLPSEVVSEKYSLEDEEIPSLFVSSSQAKDGTINISIVNVNPTKSINLDCDIRGVDKLTSVSGRMLTAKELNTHNTFDNPEQVKITDYSGASIKKGKLAMEIPAKSIVVVSVK